MAVTTILTNKGTSIINKAIADGAKCVISRVITSTHYENVPTDLSSKAPHWWDGVEGTVTGLSLVNASLDVKVHWEAQQDAQPVKSIGIMVKRADADKDYLLYAESYSNTALSLAHALAKIFSLPINAPAETFDAIGNTLTNEMNEDMSNLGASLYYDSNTKRIELKNTSDAVISSIDATAFIKDASAYYTKSETDTQISSAITALNLGAAAQKGVDTSIGDASSSNLPTSYAVKAYVDAHSGGGGENDEIDEFTTPLMLKAVADNSTVAFSGEGYEISYDNETWTTYTANDVINLNEGECVYFKTTTSKSYDTSTAVGRFTLSGSIEGYGNTFSLMFTDFTNHEAIGGDCFNSLFKDCASLIRAPQLYATTIEGATCCRYMFKGTNIKELTLRNLRWSPSPCVGMVSGCKNLKLFLLCREGNFRRGNAFEICGQHDLIDIYTYLNDPYLFSSGYESNFVANFYLLGGVAETLDEVSPFYIESQERYNTLTIEDSRKFPHIVYSLNDGATWEPLGSKKTFYLTSGQRMYFKTADRTKWSFPMKFSCDKEYSVGGNAASLIGGDLTKKILSSLGWRAVFGGTKRSVPPIKYPSILSGRYLSAIEYGSSFIEDAMFKRGFAQGTQFEYTPTLPKLTFNSMYNGEYVGFSLSDMFLGASITESPRLVLEDTSTPRFIKLLNTFKNCVNLKKVVISVPQVDFTQQSVWDTSNWLENVSANGIVYINHYVPLTADSVSGLPTGWERRDFMEGGEFYEKFTISGNGSGGLVVNDTEITASSKPYLLDGIRLVIDSNGDVKGLSCDGDATVEAVYTSSGTSTRLSGILSYGIPLDFGSPITPADGDTLIISAKTQPS